MAKDESLPYSETLRVRDSCLCLHVQRAARALARRYDEALRPLGLTSGQFSLLMSLNRPEPPSIGAVSSVLAMDRTTITANIKPLQRKGLLEVTVDPADRRSRRLLLTEAGRDLLVEAMPLWERTQEATRALVEEEDPERLCRDLRALS